MSFNTYPDIAEKTRCFLIEIMERNGEFEYYSKQLITVLSGGSLEHTLKVHQVQQRHGINWENIRETGSATEFNEGAEFDTFMDYYQSLIDDGTIDEENGWCWEDGTICQMPSVVKELSHKEATLLQKLL